MYKYDRRICLSVPFEMYDILQGELFVTDLASAIKSLRKYLTLFCIVSSPDDMEILAIEKNFNMATHDIFVCSKLFPKVTLGCSCTMYDLSNRESIKQFFQGLNYE